ncbi:TPA: kinase, partial [Streptococcus equi subsp. equi]|nr:kinase [Streptococcus equi subsp. equi]
MQLKSEVNLGLNGLAGVLFYLSSISYDNEIIEKGIDFILESLVEDSDGNRGVLISENSVSPYLSNGTAGIVQLLIYVNSDKYIKDIKNLSESLLVEFAQFSGLWNGMLGIAMTLLQVFRLTNDT